MTAPVVPRRPSAFQLFLASWPGQGRFVRVPDRPPAPSDPDRDRRERREGSQRGALRLLDLMFFLP